MAALDAGIPFEQVATLPANSVVMALLSRAPRDGSGGGGRGEPAVRQATQADIDWLTHG